MRLNKFISNSGICSRREADKFISMGLVKVNGKVITKMGIKDTLKRVNKLGRRKNSFLGSTTYLTIQSLC